MTDPAAERPTMPLLRKELVYPSSFLDQDGRLFEVDADEIRELVKDTNELMATGFKVRGHTSHDTNDSRDVLGTWERFEVDEDGHLWGDFRPRNEESKQLAEDLDTSIVVNADISLPGGKTHPQAITRVDIVPQGAAFGTRGWIELARMRARTTQEKTMSKLQRALARALGMEDSEPSMEDLEAAVIDALDLTGSEDESMVEQMSRAMKFRGSTEDPEPEAEMEAGGEDKKAEMEDPASTTEDETIRRMQSEIDALQDEKVESMLEEVPAEERKELARLFNATRKAAGFKLALKNLERQVALSSSKVSGDPLGRGQTRVAPRPEADPKSDGQATAVAKLSAAFGRRGHKTTKNT